MLALDKPMQASYYYYYWTDVRVGVNHNKIDLSVQLYLSNNKLILSILVITIFLLNVKIGQLPQFMWLSNFPLKMTGKRIQPTHRTVPQAFVRNILICSRQRCVALEALPATISSARHKVWWLINRCVS